MIEPLARLGYASKALIYALIGILAAAAAFNRGGRVTDTSGALRVILSQPFGLLLLVILGVGLCGYAVWRFLDAWQDPDRRGLGFNGLVIRIGNVIRGVIYGALGLEAFRLVRGLRGSTGREAELWTARIMELPFGVWLAGIIGLIVTIYGISQLITAIRVRVEDTLDLSGVPPRWRLPLTRIGRFGIGARGVIVAVLGVFLTRAAITHNPSAAAGTRESMIEIANAVQGRWLLLGIAAGLFAYGVDQALHAKCRRIKPVI
jgi:hypothetical protein